LPEHWALPHRVQQGCVEALDNFLGGRSGLRRHGQEADCEKQCETEACEFAGRRSPGEIAYYPAGVPRDEPLVDAVRVYNNTAYNITSLTLKIVGSAVEPEPFNFTITLDPNVSAFWGDANGDGKVGLSDIFSTITLSEDRRTITFSDGLIPSAAASPTSSFR
jgi:hypothetical protein